MKSLLLDLVIAASILLAPEGAIAEVLKVEAIGEYVMGDSDNKTDARKMALEHAKRSAAEQAGSYLVSSTAVKEGVLTRDEIVSFTSAVLKTEVLSEGVSLLDNKTTLFSLKIAATVDTSVLEKRIAELKDNTLLKSELVSLQTKNKKLLSQLEEISRQMNTKGVKDLRSLINKRDDLFTQIEKNNNAISITFAKGTLAKIAASGRKNMEDDRAKIEELLAMVAEGTVVTVGDPQVHIGPAKGGRRVKKANGTSVSIGGNPDDAQMIIPLKWETRPEVLEKAKLMMDELCEPPRHGTLDLETFGSNCSFRNKVYDSELRDHINHRAIHIIVSVGDHIVKVQRFGPAGNEKVTVHVNKVDLENASELAVKVVVENSERKMKTIVI